MGLELRPENHEERVLDRKGDSVGIARMPADLLDQLRFIGRGDVVAAFAAQDRVGHRVADTPSGGQENGKLRESTRQRSERWV